MRLSYSALDLRHYLEKSNKTWHSEKIYIVVVHLGIGFIEQRKIYEDFCKSILRLRKGQIDQYLHTLEYTNIKMKIAAKWSIARVTGCRLAYREINRLPELEHIRTRLGQNQCCCLFRYDSLGTCVATKTETLKRAIHGNKLYRNKESVS